MKKLLFKFWSINLVLTIILFFIYRITIMQTKIVEMNWFDEILSIIDVILNIGYSLLFLTIAVFSSLTFFLNLIKNIRNNYYLSALTFLGIPLFFVIYLVFNQSINTYSDNNTVFKNFTLFFVIYLLLCAVEFLIFRKKIKKIFLYSLLTFFSFQNSLSAQKLKDKENYDIPIREEKGDLNSDGKKDKVTVFMDTINKTTPLRLQIFLSQPNGKLKLVVSSTKIIEAQYPVEKKGKYNGFQIPDFFIENGILKMVSEIKNGNGSYDFKFKNDNFELIKVSKVTSFNNMDTTIETDYDLQTGVKLEKKETFSKRSSKNSKKIILIKPLPKIQDFKFSDKELY